jgi:heat shock protein HtpX
MAVRPGFVLAYDRSSKNRRNMFLLPLAALVLGAPLMLALSFGASWGLAHVLGRGATNLMGRITDGAPRYLPPSPPPPGMSVQPFDWEGLAIVMGAMSALMALPCVVLWGMVSRQTPKLLGIIGARLAEDAEQRLLENLSIGAGLAKPKLFVVETAVPNAFAIGAPGHAIIGLTRGLLTLLDRQELEGVLAHELSHIGNRDAQLNEMVAALVLFLRLPDLLLRRHHSIQEQTRLNALPEPPNPWGKLLFVLLLPVLGYFFIVGPLLGALLRAAISREREFLADADAALLTRFPEGLIRALAKVQGAGLLVGASPSVAHFYFADALAEESTLYSTHPPVSERVQRLVEIHGEIAPAILEEAVKAGAKYAHEHPAAPVPGSDELVVQDELSVLNMGNVMGKVYRALAPGCVYDRADAHTPVIAQILQGELLVVFDDPGTFRQVLTSRGVFGYLPRSVRMEVTDMLPVEVVRSAN